MVAIDTNQSQNQNFENSVINLTKLERIVKGQKITILGHDNIDVDSVISSIFLSKLLNFWGVENEFCILEEVKRDDTYVTLKELFDIDIKEYQRIGESIERKIILVDHYETLHRGKVIACIDHHPTNKKDFYPYKYVKNSCAAAYLIYEHMKKANYPFSKEDIRMLIAAMLIDTVSFRSTKTVESEIGICKKLAKEYDIDFEILEKYGLSLTEISKMTDEEILSNGIKYYSFNKKNDVISSYIQLIDMPSEETLRHWFNLLFEKLKETSVDMIIFIIYDMQNNKTYEYHVTKTKVELILSLGILSRGKDIMPRVEKQFLKK